MLVRGPVDRADPGHFEEIVILGRDDAADNHQNVARAIALERLAQRQRSSRFSSLPANPKSTKTNTMISSSNARVSDAL